MTTATTLPLRALRIGLFLNGQPLEERVLRRREPVTIGSDARCTLIVPPQRDLPGKLLLFTVDESGYSLCLPDGVSGRVTIAGVQRSVAEIRDEELPDREGVVHVALDKGALGELRIGELRLLFQLVKPPPVAAVGGQSIRDRSLRPSLIDLLGRDKRLLQLAAVSFVCHFGFVMYLRAMERPKAADIEELPDRFVKMLIPKKLEPPKPPPTPKVEPKPAEQKKEEQAKKQPDVKPGQKPPPKPEEVAAAAAAAAKAAADRQEKMAAQVQSMGALKVLTAAGPGGVLADLLKNGGTERDADVVFKEVGGVGPATGDRSLGAAKGGGTGQTQGIGGLVASGPSDGVGTGGKQEKKVTAVVQDSSPQDLDPVDLDPQAVIAKIRQYRGALVACYETALKRTPTLAGKITLKFTIGKVGKVTQVEVEVDTMHDEDVKQCIIDHAQSWRFPPPKSGNDAVQFSYPFIFQASK